MTTYPRIDRAISELRSFVRAFPEEQALLEDLKPGVSPKKALAFDEFAASILSAHRPVFGRWHRPAKASALKDVDRAENLSPSYRYFLRKYGSLTWLLASGFEADDRVFMINNVTGEGMSVLHLPPLYEEADIQTLLSDEFVEENETRGLGQAHVFHGGWGMRGYAFDRRRQSPAGEFAIVPFSIDAPLDGFPDQRKLKGRKEKIEGFDIWLEREIDHLTQILTPQFKALQSQDRADKGPIQKVSAPRPKKSVEIPLDPPYNPKVLEANAKAVKRLGDDLIPSYRETWARYDLRESEWSYFDFDVCGSCLVVRAYDAASAELTQKYLTFASPEDARAGIAGFIAPHSKKFRREKPHRAAKGAIFSRRFSLNRAKDRLMTNVWLEGATLHVKHDFKENPPRKFKTPELAEKELERTIAAMRIRGYIPVTMEVYE